MKHPGLGETNELTKELSECRLYLYYAEEPDEEAKALILAGVKNWSMDLQGSEPVMQYGGQGSLEEIFLVWLPGVVAAAIIGWAIKRGLDSLLSPKGTGGNETEPSLTGPGREDERDSEPGSLEIVGVTEAMHQAELTVGTKYIGIDSLLDYISDAPRPTHLTFVKLGQKGELAQMVSLDFESGNGIISIGPNSDIMRWAAEWTFRRWRKEPELEAPRAHLR